MGREVGVGAEVGEKGMPRNVEAERCVIGALLQENTHLYAVIEKGLKAEDFFLHQHRVMFDAVCRMSEAATPADPVTLADYLERAGKLEDAGGIAYLAAVTDGVPRVLNVEHYARIVKEKSMLRSLAHAGLAIQQRALADDEAPTALIDQAEALIFALAEDRFGAGLQRIRDVFAAAWHRVEAVIRGDADALDATSTGYADLDRVLRMRRGNLILLAARPSVGKTTLAVNIASNVAVRAGEPVAIFSLEMTREEVMMRLVAQHCMVDLMKLLDGRDVRGAAINVDEAWKVRASRESIEAAPLRVDDTGLIGVMEMLAKARRMKHECGGKLALVIVDYLQLLTARGKFNSRNDAVSDISRGLKMMAKELACPVLALSQLTRENEKHGREPQLHDLRDSGSLEQDADVVVFLHRPETEMAGDVASVKAIVAKQRNGPTGNVYLKMLRKCTRFEQAMREDDGGGSDL